MAERSVRISQRALEDLVVSARAKGRLDERERITQALERVKDKGFLTVNHVLRITRGGGPRG